MELLRRRAVGATYDLAGDDAVRRGEDVGGAQEAAEQAVRAPRLVAGTDDV